ncbi:uncharacterized protein N7483_000500 [Penicillium malachiteum]|uniref:uncharacterized protein n=1 Tax=Penicillium malachiteum TaxID=1324776 RepID=UPI00254803F2|nr:uncharacterized protein N7483_000500 [Penicillium malachiteum]KAJ5735375.1 hypothetical protein N7483_000500 [Penicillium malachiteum]
METRQTTRKRRNSSVSNSRSTSPVSHRTRQCVSGSSGAEPIVASSAPKPAVSTPKKSRKRVRFSDPGPQLLGNGFCSTGLTPAMQRTSFDGGISAGDATPSRKARRRSAPTPRYRRRSFDPVEPFDETSSERIVQFTPLRQILDTRTKRRIRRIGLSDEINSIQREKRDAASFEKTLATLLRERDALQQELTSMKQIRGASEERMPSYESYWRSSQIQVNDLEEQTTILQDHISIASNSAAEEHEPSVQNDGDTFMINDSAILTSESPVFRGQRHMRSPVPEQPGLFDDSRLDDGPGDTEIDGLNLDLEAARNEKRDLFDACRSQISAFENSELGDILQKSSPPADFLDNILNTLTTALSRASDAIKTLEGISQECSSLGFSGTSLDDVISSMRNEFRSARLELERTVPGETPGGLENGKATLSALVKRVKSLARELRSERKYHYGSLGREKALRGQFDNLLYRYETATEKISTLENSIASSASDMIHTRMRMQDLESEDQEKTVGIDRLNTALDKYHEDVKGLEELVSKMEDGNVSMKAKYRQQISALRKEVAHEREQRSAIELSATEYESRIRKLEETVEKNRIQACALTAEMEILEKEHEKALDQKAQEQLQHHEQETGILNVRISELSTSLEATRSETQRLRRVNSGLEEQLQVELEARDDLLDKWAAEQARSFAHMKEAVSSERRRAKVRAANWELKSDDLMSDGTTIAGSEPITPVSMTRFVDVEMGRGKDRRRIDSNFGIFTNEDESEDMPDIQHRLDSDIDLPTSDLIA